MIEVVFSQSACGSLKVAQHKDAQAFQNGKARDVFCIDAAWSIGDITENEIGSDRRAVFERLLSILPTEERTCQRIDDAMLENRAALYEIRTRAARGEALRIWYSHNPDDMCGFHWLLALLRKIPTRGAVYTVRLPEWEYIDRDTLCSYVGWGEIAAGQWGRYLALQQQAQPALFSACAAHWQQLQKENAPLRIFLNGRLQSAPETIYDSFILQEIARQPQEFREANAVGNILGTYQLGIGDAWIALRIEQFIKDGLLEVLSAPAPGWPVYRRMLRKCAP